VRTKHSAGALVKSGRIAQGVKQMTHDQTNRKRATLDDETIREIRRRLAEGDYQHDIAADLGINQGRVSEVNTGKRHPSNDNWVGK
jgi:DNA-binding transcriptional regulator YiaG